MTGWLWEGGGDITLVTGGPCKWWCYKLSVQVCTTAGAEKKDGMNDAWDAFELDGLCYCKCWGNHWRLVKDLHSGNIPGHSMFCCSSIAARLSTAHS